MQSKEALSGRTDGRRVKRFVGEDETLSASHFSKHFLRSSKEEITASLTKDSERSPNGSLNGAPGGDSEKTKLLKRSNATEVQIKMAYAEKLFSDLAPLDEDDSLEELLVRNRDIRMRMEENMLRLRKSLSRADLRSCVNASQALFDLMGEIGSVEMMRQSYKMLMACRSSNLKHARKILSRLEDDMRGLQVQILGFDLH